MMVKKKVDCRSKLISSFILLSFLSFTGGSCGQELKYITITPGNPTISTPGVATGARPGVTAITGTLGTISGSATLTVSSATLQSIAVTPANPVLPKGLTQQFTAMGHYSDGSDHDVSSMVVWSSASTTAVTINAIGQAIPVGTANASSTIAATLGPISGTTILTVSSATPRSIAVTPASLSLPGGLTQQFVAAVTYSDNRTYDATSLVSWSSSSANAATISSSGFVTTPAVTLTGNSTITAALGSVSGSAPLTVSPAALTSISVTTPSSLTVPNGRSVQLTATGTFSDGSTHDLTSLVTWGAQISTVAFVNNFGLATAIGPAASTSSMTATLSGISGSTTLIVSTAALQTVTVTPLNPTIPTGAIQRFAAVANYSDGTSYDVTPLILWSAGAATNPVATMFTGMVQQFRAMGTYNGGTADISSNVTWSSGSASVANIFPSGYAVAFGAGSTTISASLDGISASTQLTVSPAVALKSITVTPANLTLSKGTSQQYTATGNYYDGSISNLTPYVTWNSSAGNIAVMNPIGLVTGAGTGNSTISATLGSFSGSTNLTVQ